MSRPSSRLSLSSQSSADLKTFGSRASSASAGLDDGASEISDWSDSDVSDRRKRQSLHAQPVTLERPSPAKKIDVRRRRTPSDPSSAFESDAGDVLSDAQSFARQALSTLDDGELLVQDLLDGLGRFGVEQYPPNSVLDDSDSRGESGASITSQSQFNPHSDMLAPDILHGVSIPNGKTHGEYWAQLLEEQGLLPKQILAEGGPQVSKSLLARICQAVSLSPSRDCSQTFGSRDGPSDDADQALQTRRGSVQSFEYNDDGAVAPRPRNMHPDAGGWSRKEQEYAVAQAAFARMTLAAARNRRS